jgi:hypothetical protein
MKTQMIVKLFVCVALVAASVAQAQTILFEENFDADATADFNVVIATDLGTDAVGPTTVVDLNSYDYSTATTNFTTPTYTIPEAPNSGGGDAAQRGAFLQVNNDGTSPAIGSIAIYPNIAAITGPYTMTFDFWYLLNFGGSTEYIGAGVQHAGDKALYRFSDDETVTSFTTTVSISDGYFFQYTSDGGSSIDISFLEGEDTEGVFDQSFAADGSAGFEWGPLLDLVGDNNGTLNMPGTSVGNYFANDIEDYHINSGNFGLLRSGEADGPNEAWVTMRISHDAGLTRVEQDIYDGNGFITICTYDDPDNTWTSGVPSIILEDAFGSTNPFGALIIDNIVVTDEAIANVDSWEKY